MNTKIRSLLTAASLLALSAVTSHAQLLLQSTTSTFFNVVGGSGVVVANGGPGNPSSITVGGSPFVYRITTVPSNIGTNLIIGTPYVIDSWVMDLNGVDLSTIPSSFDFSMGFDFGPTAGIDAAALFHVALSASGPGILHYAVTPTGGTDGFYNNGVSTFAYKIIADGVTGDIFGDPSGTASNGSAHINIRLSSVPEPSTYALFGAIALMGVVVFRRSRRALLAA